MPNEQRNVFGEPIEVCSLKPTTGFYRTGCCETGPEDVGVRTLDVEEFESWHQPRQRERIDRELRDRCVGARIRLVVENVHGAVAHL